MSTGDSRFDGMFVVNSRVKKGLAGTSDTLLFASRSLASVFYVLEYRLRSEVLENAVERVGVSNSKSRRILYFHLKEELEPRLEKEWYELSQIGSYGIDEEDILPLALYRHPRVQELKRFD